MPEIINVAVPTYNRWSITLAEYTFIVLLGISWYMA